MMRGAIMAAGLLGSLAVAAPGSAQTVVVPPGYAGPSGQCWWNEGPGPGRWVDCNPARVLPGARVLRAAVVARAAPVGDSASA